MKVFDLFCRCFPMLCMSERVFSDILEGITDKSFELRENDCLIGLCTVKDNALTLICVSPEHRGKGAGAKLFNMAEQYVMSCGYDNMSIGCSSSELFIGAAADSVPFFEKMGVVFGEAFEEMEMDIREFSFSEYDLTDEENLSFGFYRGDMAALRSAVSEVDEDWADYFSGDNIFCAFQGDSVASFCIIDTDIDCLITDEGSRVGSIGCVGTVPKFRRRGIGLKMVAAATDILRSRGMTKCFIHYTAVADWYARLGYKTFLKLYMGNKERK